MIDNRLQDGAKEQIESEDAYEVSGEEKSARWEPVDREDARSEKNLSQTGDRGVNKETISTRIEAPPGGYTRTGHPSRSLETRAHGYGIGGGYEKSYVVDETRQPIREDGHYGALSHGGYYGAGTTARRFKVGQAGFREELMWYRKQYGEKTSKYNDGE